MRGEAHIADIVVELERHNLLPAIVFRTSRNQCDVDAQRAATNKRLRLPVLEQRKLREIVKEVIRRYDMDEALLTSHPQYNGLVTSGVGAHHAGQLLMWRLLLEELMASGCLRALIATGTVAAGVDFPARSVVVTAHSRRGADGYANLSAAEFQQMSGRAGRRGKDTVGFCFAAPSPFCDARSVLKISKTPPEPLRSSYFPSPSTVLNLLRYRNVDDLRYTVERSLASFIDAKEADEIEREAADVVASFPAALQSAWSEVQKSGEVSQEESQRVLSLNEYSRDERKRFKRMRRLYRKAEETRIRQTTLLETALSGLRTLNHLEGTSLSEKGYWAANLCTTLVLELAEIIEEGLLNDISKERLVAIVASIAGDNYRRYLPTKEPPLGKDDVAEIQACLNRVQTVRMPGVADERTVDPSAAHTAVTWMYAESWQDFRNVLFLNGVAEGDAARLLTQTADHLSQLCRLFETHKELAIAAEEAKRLILRPPLTEVLSIGEDPA